MLFSWSLWFWSEKTFLFWWLRVCFLTLLVLQTAGSNLVCTSLNVPVCSCPFFSIIAETSSRCGFIYRYSYLYWAFFTAIGLSDIFVSMRLVIVWFIRLFRFIGFFANAIRVWFTRLCYGLSILDCLNEGLWTSFYGFIILSEFKLF